MKLESIRIEKAENGFTLDKRYSPENKQENMTSYDSMGEKTVHESVDSLLKAVKACLTGKHTKKAKKHNYSSEISAKVARSY